MTLLIPAELKKISPYIRRAEELDKDKGTPESRLVAYYCRQYAVHTGIPLVSTSPAAKECLGKILESLEVEKPAMDNFTREEAKFLCSSFAVRIFDKADEEDRMGAATKATAKTFYAAASFIQILDQFMTEGDPGLDENKKKIVYAKWKATEILKAIKEGKTPTPGGYGEEDEPIGGAEDAEGENQEDPVASINGHPNVDESFQKPPSPRVETVEDDGGGEAEKEDEIVLPPPLPAAPLAPPPPVYNPPEPEPEPEPEPCKDEGTEVELGPPPAYPGDSSDTVPNTAIPPETQTYKAPPAPIIPPVVVPPPSQASPPKKGGFFGFAKKTGKVSKAQMGDAVELTKFALAALEDKDADLAASRLQQALQALGK